jgi:hypothetical protein
MPDRPFISRELDRRIASAQAAIEAGKTDQATANAGLMPWAAAEAWLVGEPFGISPRDDLSRSADLCPIDDAIAAIASARDTIERTIAQHGRNDLREHWQGLCDAIRRLERQRDGHAAFRALGKTVAGETAAGRKGALPPMAPSKLADMFDANGDPIPLPSRQAA